MAIIHRAQIRPTKLEMLQSWLPRQPWYADAPDAVLVAVGAFRFDDPAGEVGIETHLVRAGEGPVYQVPWTYRGAPLAGAEASLVGTMEHTALGRRWVYDACADPVYARVLAAVLAGETEQAEEVFSDDQARRPPTASVAAVPGDGDGVREGLVPGGATVVPDADRELVVLRVPGEASASTGRRALVGTWSGQDAPAVLAVER